MKYLVTGGAGFIGSHLVERLLSENARVTVVDNFDPFYPRSLKVQNLAVAERDPNFHLVEADICDPIALRQVVGHYDCIVHLAGRGGVRPSIDEPRAYQRINVDGTQNLLEFARELNVRQFVFASSSSVYGLNPRVPWSEEDRELMPISPYASTKVSSEYLGRVYSHLYDIRFIALRFFTAYGPRQRPDLAIRTFAEAILAERPITLFGDGSTSRDYTYIDDIVSGVRASLDYTGNDYEVINLGNSDPVSLITMVRTLEKALNKRAVLNFGAQQAGDAPRTCADISKARVLLGFGSNTPFSEGIGRFARWLIEQRTSVQLEGMQPTAVGVAPKPDEIEGANLNEIGRAVAGA